MPLNLTCTRCGLRCRDAADLYDHLVTVERWEAQAAYVRCMIEIYPEEYAPDAAGVLRRVTP